MPADNISKGLHSFLVRLSYTPESVSGDIVHAMEHIMHLLTPEDEHAVTGYYGLFGIERIALDEIAASRGVTPEEMMETIDGCVRKLAITPEWQMIQQTI
ncbi:MAG: hypothetical protein OSJ56_07245 [Prevotella sp.]|uniref:hypothetical protein n=1 Tax=Prevotella sp. PTAC TaxID=2736295 RepID=UPI001556FE76|nr:hypothetical protein [Prevotella sp. PTAC]MCX4293834.1 hypothetical protein [Prevotella sp.]NPD55298.1 hypothetical protein [Prevotella sp. PTAC]